MKQVSTLFIIISVGLLSLASPAMAATTQVHVARYANDNSTILSEITVNYSWMKENLPVYGDGITHYYAQGPVFVDNPDPAVEQQLRWNPEENTNVLGKDMGAVKGTNLRDLCDLAGGMSPGERVKIRASDGFSKWFPYENVYGYTAREGPMVLTWYCAGLASYPGPYPDTGYSDGMRVVWFADDSVNPWGVHAFGNYDWHEAADPAYWYYFSSGGEDYPTTTGLSVKLVSDLLIYSNDPPGVEAAFSANTTSGPGPLAVRFTDQSSGYPTRWEWDLDGNGTIDSNETNPVTVYYFRGNYTVSLQVSRDGSSDTDVKVGYITVADPVLPPFPGCNATPADPNGDYLYEDVNGNGRVDFNDVVRYFKNMTWIQQQGLSPYFDYNGNKRIDFADLVMLFKMVGSK